MDIRYFNVESLTQAIEIGEREGFNRQLDRRILKEMHATYPVKARFFMVHQHKQGVPTDAHARLDLSIRLKSRKDAFAIVDVPFDLWQSLPTHPMTRSIPAPEWKKSGRKWKPDLFLVGGNAHIEEMRFVHDLICRYSDSIVAHYLGSPLPGYWGIELQFGKSEQHQKGMMECHRRYLAAFDSKGRLRKNVRRQFAKAKS